jgi:hypothetical protein
MGWLLRTLALLLLGLAILGCQSQETKTHAPIARSSSRTPENALAETRERIVPLAGTETSYGIPLSLDNTQRFIDYYETESITPQQQEIVTNALEPLAAPCCDDNPMSTCCCPCNLAKSVWGLSRYVVAEHDYSVDQVREAALEWLHFTRGDYYIIQDMEKNGIDPAQYGLVHENSCYVGKCEFPVQENGCAGMSELVS